MVLAGNLLAGRYRLDEPVGTGWFSEVWRATDVALSRPVAVKLLHPAYAQQPEALARFRAEARHAAALRHENIARIYDYDEPAEGPQPYLVMELVDGPSLAGVLAGGPLDAARTIDVVAQAAAGLQAAHAMGLVHRDIKPGNLLLASSGTVKITDWGIARAVGSVPGPVTGIVTGTAEYLAPERIAGAQAAPASDLYALGVVAYECLAGAPPFVGEPPDVACAHRDHPVPPLPGSVPADVSALVMRLVAKDPAGRPGSAAEVAQQAGRLRHDLRDDVNVDGGRTPYPLAAAAAVPPPPPAMAAAAIADNARRQVPAASRPASRARTDARRLRRRPVLVLACVAIAGLSGMVLAITVGVASVRHLADAPPSAQPGHPASGTVAGPPARQPSSASPSRSARPATSPGDTRTVPVVVSNHRTITGSMSSQERIRRHRDGSDAYYSRGHGDGHGHGHGNGNGHGNGHGHGHGNGHGHGHGHGNGHGNGHGHGNAQVLSISS
ncbi:MAG: serine/threonine-protein kinase [Streptosporangiaceae bacterium]